MSSVSTSTAPLDGLLRYPRDTLITVVRSILKANEEHHIALRNAADENGDEKEEDNHNSAIVDINLIVFELDSTRWKADYEKFQPEKVWDAEALQHFADPKAAEKALFNMTAGQHKVEWVINDSVKFRKESRGQPPSEDPDWVKEDAVLDLLQFITKCGHEGLFEPAEDK